MTEDQLEQETLAWLQDVGYTHLYGPDMAHERNTVHEKKPLTIAGGPCRPRIPSP